MFTSGKYSLTVGEASLWSACPVHLRGTLMRCREVGRDAAPASVVHTNHVPGRRRGASRGTKTAGRSDRTVDGVKPEMPRGAPSWRGASADAPGSGDPGPPGVIVRAVRRKLQSAEVTSTQQTVALGTGAAAAASFARKGASRADQFAVASSTLQQWLTDMFLAP